LAVANSAEFGHLPPSQIVPRLADQGRVWHLNRHFIVCSGQKTSCGTAGANAPRKPRAVCATAPNEL
jgi:putative transposase